MKPAHRLLGHIDVEVQAPRTACRDEVIQQALSRWSDSRIPRISRVRVTNLVAGQWSVRFYL